jgi:hypothetical protein
MVRALVILSILAVMVTGCSTTYDLRQPAVPTGPLQRDRLTDAFLHSYPDEPIGEPFLTMIRQARGGVHVLVFMGTWCSDSKHHVPRFLRIADSTGMTDLDYSFYALDRAKTSPDGLERQYKIERVPTFIFFRGEHEIGRIVESPKTTLEGDILTILAGKGS